MKKLGIFIVFLSVFVMFSSGIGCGKSYREESRAVPMGEGTDEIAWEEETAGYEGGYVSRGNFKIFPVYTDKASPDNHFTPSGFMGDHADVSMDLASMENPHSGTTCMKFVYTGKSSQGQRWSGIYWQNPPNNWGDKDGGFDLTGATKLTFWARGAEGGERIEEFKMGGITGRFSDTDTAGIGPVVLTKEWKQYIVDLTGKDLSSISGGFVWSTNVDVNPGGATFYLDDIRYE